MALCQEAPAPNHDNVPVANKLPGCCFSGVFAAFRTYFCGQELSAAKLVLH
jgi:hypothetical protein